MRARNIKPGFFSNEILGTLDPIICLLFAGLWGLADRTGVLEDRPMRIKAELFPYRDALDINGYLTVLERLKFIHRYKVGGKGFIKVNEFEKHQSPHHTERAKNYPQPSDADEECELTPLDNGELPVPERSDSLIHRFSDSLIQKTVDGSACDGTPDTREEIKPNRAALLCGQLRKIGISAAPHQMRTHQWDAVLAIRSDEEILAVAEIAKTRKPGQAIPLAYLLPILQDTGTTSTQGKNHGTKEAKRQQFIHELTGGRLGNAGESERVIDGEAHRTD